MSGMSSRTREVLVTSVVSAEPEAREASPPPSLWPFVAALATTAIFIGSIFNEWVLVWGSIPFALALIGWFWPRPEHSEEVAVEMREEGIPEEDIKAVTR